MSTPVRAPASQAGASASLAIFHTADLHSGAFRFLPNYLQRTVTALSNISKVVLASQATTRILVIAGDLYDRKMITEAERNVVLDFITNLVANKVHVVVINGNHDFYTEEHTLLEPLRFMSRLNPYLHVVLDDPGLVVIGKIAFGCVPCQQHLSTDRLEGYAKSMYAEAQAAGTTVFYMVVHEAIFGAVNHRRTWVAKDEGKYLKIPDLPWVKGWMLGDIHEAQEILPNAKYSGAPLQIKSDESERCCILQWAGDKTRKIIIPTPGFRATDDIETAKSMAAEGHIVRYTGNRDTLDEATIKELPVSVVLTGDLAAVALDIDAASNDAAVALASGNTSDEDNEYDLITPLPFFLAREGLNERQQARGVELAIKAMSGLAARETVDA